MNEVPVEGSPIGSKGTMRKLTRKEYLSESVIDSTHTFVTSDHHFWSCRHPFQKLTTREEDDAHIALWNQVVGKDDLVLYVGDFCDSERVVDLAGLVGRLNGRKILVKGNHEQRLLDLGLIGEEVYRMAYGENFIGHERTGHTRIIKHRFDTFANLHDSRRSGYA